MPVEFSFGALAHAAAMKAWLHPQRLTCPPVPDPWRYLRLFHLRPLTIPRAGDGTETAAGTCS